jgi:hypothetical protein
MQTAVIRALNPACIAPSIFSYACQGNDTSERTIVAKKTILVCDRCGTEVDAGKGATLRLSYSDARRGAREADLCDSCAGGMPGRAVARRGRRPKAAAA